MVQFMILYNIFMNVSFNLIYFNTLHIFYDSSVITLLDFLLVFFSIRDQYNMKLKELYTYVDNLFKIFL